MADDQSGSLNCCIYKFVVSLSFQDVQKIQICQRKRLLYILNNSFSLDIVKLHGKQFDSRRVTGITQFLVCSDLSSISDIRFICLKKDGCLQCYNSDYEVVFENGIKEVLSDLQDERTDAKNVHLCTYQGDYMILTLQSKLIVLETQMREFKFITQFALDESTRTFNKFQILSEFIATMDGNTLEITLYSLTRGEVVATLNLARMNIDLDRLLSWQFTPDLKSLVIVENTFTVTCVNLDNYVNKFTGCVTRTLSHPSSFFENEVLNTVHVGDTSWRRLLLSIHNRNSMQHSSPPWYIDENRQDSSRSKHRPKWRISGFFKGRKNLFDEIRTNDEKKIFLPATLHGMNIVDIVMGKISLSIHLQSPKENVVCVCDIQKQLFNTHRLPLNCFVMLSHEPQYPHLVVMETQLTCIIPCIEQEDFVSKMMSYAGASIADLLCHMNKWGRCSLPLHTLETGLKHRQLDTVVFFLKSKENLFSMHKTMMSSPTSQTVPSPTWSNHHDNIVQLQPALQLLIQSIQDNLNDSQSRDFVRRLSEITLEFLYEILSDALDVQTSVKTKLNKTEVEDITKSIDIILEDIAEVRQCVRNIKKGDKEGDTRVPDVVDGGKQNNDEMIEEALLANTIPTLQASLLEKGDNSFAEIDYIINLSIVRAVKYLSDKQTKPAIAIFSNLGLNVSDKLWEIASICEDITIRDFIIEELTGKICLSEDQMEVIKFVREFEETYSSSSFRSAVAAARQQELTPDRLESIFMSLGGSPSFDITSDCGDLSSLSEVSMDERSGRYGHVLLDWVQKWDHETRQLIIIENDPDDVQLLHLRYFLRYNKLDKLLSWIHGSGDKQIPIMHQLMNHLKECTAYVRLVLIDALASKGVYPKTEDFNKMISQLCLVGGVLKMPHPLAGQSNAELENFHKNFLQYSIQNSLPNVVWQYCSIHRISHKLLESLLTTDCHWLSMLVSMYRLQQKPKDHSAMVEASMSNACLVWKIDQSSITEIIKKGEVLTAMATIMYSKNKLQQLVGDKRSTPLIPGLENAELELALQSYPKLHSAIFPAKDTIQNDVTVYQLLMDNAAFDPRKLFGWQSINTLASDESPKVMPYFSQPDLVTKYGYVEKIRYMYYLQQGRPSFGFVSFLAEAYDMEPTGITQQRVDEAASTALWIGVKNFSNTQVSCTCVVFTEMLGHDTCLLRTYIQIGNEILSHLNSTVTGNTEKKKEMSQRNETDVVSWMSACVLRRGKYAKVLLTKLEDAILYHLDKENINRTSFEAGQKWTIAILFCHLLHIPPTTKYLELTAKCDKWLPFLWFSQIHQYSKEQLQNLLYHFKSQHLQQHLHYVIENAEAKVQGSKNNDKSSDKRKQNRDLRSTLYSRIGLAKEVSQVKFNKSVTWRIFERSSSDDETETPERTQPTRVGDDNDFLMTDSEAISDDLFTVVFHAQSSRYPWKYLLGSGIAVYNPILIELAACLENASLITCICGWLVAMMNEQEHNRFLEDHGKAIWKWNIKHLNQLIDIYLSHNWNKTLMTGFHIFMPECTILSFLKFSTELVDSRNYTQCRTYLQEYKDAVSMAFSERSEDQTDKDHQQTTILQDQDWVQQTTYRILHYHMTHTTNLFDLLQLLKILDTESAVLLFNFDVPDFGMLSRLLNILVNNQFSNLNFNQLLVSHDQFVAECQRVISLLVNKQLFQSAREFCSVAVLGSEHVTLSELRCRKEQLEKSSVWKSGTARKTFWLKCSNILKENKADNVVSQFYQREAENTEDLIEKSFLYQLCLDHLENAKDPPSYSELYRKMWLSRIQAKIEGMEIRLHSDIDDAFPPLESTKQLHNQKDLLCFGKMPHKGEIDSSLNLKEDAALNSMMDDLLEKGQVCECCQLSAEFKHYSQDLTIILTCIRLALGEVSLKQNMDMDMVNLVAGGPGRLHRASVSSPALVPKSSSGNLLVPMGPVTYSSFGIEMEKVVSTMETLSSHCNHGNQFCKQIINCFVISLVLSSSYESVVNSEEFEILRSLLETDFPYKVKLAGDYLMNSSLSAAEVTGFLSDSFVTSYKVKHGLVEEKPDLMFDDSEGSVSQFIKLCPDPSLLGDRILDAVITLSVDQDLLSPQVLAMQTDILILAHSCHTVACNMEGISNVLRAARALTSCLQSTQQFTLMVQLLTGIGRFGEMTYIFDSIKQNDQFELLLKKGVDRDNRLKLSILDYLKRYHPKDKETYDMVAHNFMLHRQIAETLETRAISALDGLKSKPLENTSEVQTSLQTVIQYFTDAAGSYSKEKCVRHAQKCVRQARLVALQLHHLSSGTQLLHLSDQEADIIISKHPKFLEALILSQSYGRKGCWPDAICNNVILNGDFRYLQDFKQHLKLSPSQIKETVLRYQQSPNKTNSSLGNLKKLLTYCKDVEIQYNLAVEFSLKDIVTSLENGDSGAYIKDIIANKI